jgi:hypothetical protein
MDELKEEYIVFDELLQKSKSLREYANQNEKMMFEILRMDIKTDGKVHWLETVGREMISVLSVIEKFASERKNFLAMKL